MAKKKKPLTKHIDSLGIIFLIISGISWILSLFYPDSILPKIGLAVYIVYLAVIILINIKPFTLFKILWAVTFLSWMIGIFFRIRALELVVIVFYLVSIIRYLMTAIPSFFKYFIEAYRAISQENKMNGPVIDEEGGHKWQKKQIKVK